ncbi:hypothetical protein TNIN_169081, partial [Trichonephila inaurata madagascariensis]
PAASVLGTRLNPKFSYPFLATLLMKPLSIKDIKNSVKFGTPGYPSSRGRDLSTVLNRIEVALNNPPLIYERETDDNSAALTPPHLLTGKN